MMASEEPQEEVEAGAEPETETEAPEPRQADPGTPEPTAEAPSAPTSALSLAISSLRREKDETWDRLLRTAAEYENYKKRSKRDVSDAAKRAEDRVVLECLPVIDNLERALAHAEEEEGALVDGVRMVYKQFLTMLEKFDIRPFDSVGEPFDPELHEAIQQIPSDMPSGVVCHELQRGYKRTERLVRPAMVVVSSGPAAGAEEESEASEEQESEASRTEEQSGPDGAGGGANK
jgi:molecular chaperone GrpE